MRLEGSRRKAVAIAVLAVLAGAAWLSLGVGKPRLLVMILLAGFALRVMLTPSPVGSRSPGEGG